MDTLIAAASLAVALCALAISYYFWRLSFRPIVTAAVKTNSGGNVAICYDLVVLNSGTIPAKSIRLIADDGALNPTFGRDASEENKQLWLACFHIEIPILQNGAKYSCSFGTTQANDAGFWKYGAIIPITIAYDGWFGTKYCEEQTIRIIDSDSFTGHQWG